MKYHALPPINLLLSLNESTAEWHFIDKPFPKSLHCRLSNSKNVVWAINTIASNSQKNQLQSTKAIQLVFLTHYLGDIHQPLHTETNVTNGCSGDRGGNSYCLKENKNGKCAKNLHALWDRAVGYLKPHPNISSLAFKLESTCPRTQYHQELIKNNPEEWANETLEMLNFIYSTPQYSTPSRTYYQSGQSIAKARLTLAGYRLADELNAFL